ncbi:MAG: hypothetical protein ACYTFK_14540 [Planctomycetota bacterium]|jgi:hypothetical protein
MFWINLEWLLFAKPYNTESDEDTIRMNPLTLSLWRSMPEKYQGIAIVLEIMRTERY